METLQSDSLLKEALCCLELICSNVQASKLDFSYFNKLYDDVENAMHSLIATTENRLALASLTSLLEMFSLHRSLLKVLQNTRNQAIDTVGLNARGSKAERKASIESMKRSFTNAQMGGMDAVIGAEDAKNVLREACIFPLWYPHLFKGAVRPWRRILLFGPPGTGKTLLVKGLAEVLGIDTFCVSSATLFSAWIGESEKLIKDLFETAKKNAENSMVFIDEIDSMCRQRTNTEDEHSRRVKTELLRQLEGMSSCAAEREPLILAATNCPWDIDPAFLRRFQRRIYVGLPNRSDRKIILESQFSGDSPNLTTKDWEKILDSTEGFSGADLSHLVSAVAMIPIRELHTNKYWKFTSDKIVPCKQGSLGAYNHTLEQILSISSDRLAPRPVELNDFLMALQSTPRTVTIQLLKQYDEFNKSF